MITSFVKYFENKGTYYTKSFSKDDFVDEIYDFDNYDLKDPTLEDRIRFFNFRDDTGFNLYDNNFHYVVLYEDKKIIGICKIGHYSSSERGDDPNFYMISFFSIDRNYRNRGFTRLIVKGLMELLKEKGWSLGSSSWTVPGNLKLRPVIKDMAKKYGIDYLDHDKKHDSEWMYDKNLINIEEMTPEERDEFDSDREKNKFTNEKVYYRDIPNWFYLVLRGEGKLNSNPNKYLTWESLSRMKFDGLRGISDNPEIANAWFDVRPIMVVMPGKEVKKINKIDPILYFNPDELVKNNFEALMRIFDNENRNENNWGLESTLIKIFQNVTMITKRKNWEGVIGNRKTAKIYGTWHVEGRLPHIKTIISMLDKPKIYNTLSDFIVNKITNGSKINNTEDFARMIGEGIEKNKEIFLNTTYGTRKELKPIVDHYEKYGTKFIKKVIKWSLTSTGLVYNKREGEWIIKGGTQFNIPEGSHLFIKITPPYEDEEGYQKWLNDVKKTGKRLYPNEYVPSESRGLEINNVKEKIDLYHLDNMYKIHFVKHRHEMFEILKRDFKNE